MKHLLLNIFLKVIDEIKKKFSLQPIFDTYHCLNHNKGQRTPIPINNTTPSVESRLKCHCGNKNNEDIPCNFLQY